MLASRSPRRAELLRSVGARFEVRTGTCNELWEAGETPVAYAERTASDKLRACPREPGELRLAADTVVWIDEASAPLGKPADRDEARRMLGQLQRASWHHVTTAFAVDATPDAGDAHFDVLAVTTRVQFRALVAQELTSYLDSGEWSDKAGGYGIQAGAASFVPAIEGSYTNVVGLPLAEVVVALRARGVQLSGPGATA